LINTSAFLSEWYAVCEGNSKIESTMEKNELIRYRTFADALIRLNNAASTLLQEGADPEAIKQILSGIAKLFAELETRMAQALPEDREQLLDLNMGDSQDAGWKLPPPQAGQRGENEAGR
jgi:hypothetical protein